MLEWFSFNFLIIFKELLNIREELKKSGLLLHNKKFLNANTATGSNSKLNMDSLGSNFNQPKPLMFVSKTFTNNSDKF